MINEDRRGAILETIITRMKTLYLNRNDGQLKTKIRFIAVSATIPNIDDLAHWFGGENSVKFFK